jgi:hypothetical protein
MAGKCVAAKVPALRGRNRRRIRLTRLPGLYIPRAAAHESPGPHAVGAEQIRSLSPRAVCAGRGRGEWGQLAAGELVTSLDGSKD